MTDDARELARRIAGASISRPEDAAALARRAVAPLRPADAAEQAKQADQSASSVEQIPGPQGEPGKRGPVGPIGPMPAHEWSGTKLRIEQAPGGEWGKEVDLKGDKGEPGRDGLSGVIVQKAEPTFSYMPGGW